MDLKNNKAQRASLFLINYLCDAIYGFMSATKIIRPMICQKLFAGLANERSSTMTEFHKSLPTNPSMMNATTNEKKTARNSTYASRFLSESLPLVIPSIAAENISFNAISMYSSDFIFHRADFHEQLLLCYQQ